MSIESACKKRQPGEGKAEVLRAVLAAPGPLSRDALLDTIDMNIRVLGKCLTELRREGLIESNDAGHCNLWGAPDAEFPGCKYRHNERTRKKRLARKARKKRKPAVPAPFEQSRFVRVASVWELGDRAKQ